MDEARSEGGRETRGKERNERLTSLFFSTFCFLLDFASE